MTQEHPTLEHLDALRADAISESRHVFARNTQAVADLGQSLFDNPQAWPRINGRDGFDTALCEIATSLIQGKPVAFDYGCLSAFKVTMRLPENRSPAPTTDVLVAVLCGPSGGTARLPLTGGTWQAAARALDLLTHDAKAINYLVTALGAAIEVVTRKPTIPEVLPHLRAYYAQPDNKAGGSLRLVLDDGNVTDDDVSFCVQYAVDRGDETGVKLAELLLRMSQTQRRELGAMIHREA